MAKKTNSEDKLSIKVQKRQILGKKVKQLRRDGLIPGNVYGEAYSSQAITIANVDFRKLFKKAGETHVVYLQISDDKEEVPVLIHHVQRHPIHESILHVEFRKVDLKKKIETQVPIAINGESEAVGQNKGILQTISDSILIEAYPDKIPSEIAIDITQLKEVNDQIQIKDLATSNDYIVKDDPEKVIVRITEHKEEEITPQTEVVETEITEQKVEAEIDAQAGEEKAIPEKEPEKATDDQKKE